MDRSKEKFFFDQKEKYLEVAESVVKRAVNRGADQAEAYIEWKQRSEFQVRLQEPESVKQASSKGLGIRFIKDGKLGFVSTTDLNDEALSSQLDRAMSLAKISGADSCNQLPEMSAIEESDLDIMDTTLFEMESAKKLEIAGEIEKAALDEDKSVTNSEGGSFSDLCKGVVIANSSGCSAHYYKTQYSAYCSPVVSNGEEKRTNYWFSSATHFKDLDDSVTIGRKAAQRAVRMLGAKKVKTQTAPVIFDQLIASGFAGTIMQAVSGEAQYKKESFLWDKKGAMIGPAGLNIVDDGLMRKGIGSRLFDGDGQLSSRKEIVNDGSLQVFLFDHYNALKADTVSTGNGMRSYRSLPSVGATNFYIENGDTSLEQMIASVKNGFYITSLIGFGINIVNGNYSRGAEGIWIENGKLTFPVHEVTISGNIADMLLGIEAIGNDIRFAGSASSPSLMINSMVISGT